MKDLIDYALNALQIKGPAYGDVRLVRRLTENIATKDGVVEALEQYENEGMGIRVLVDGAWGFAGTSHLAKESLVKTVQRAIKLAKAASLVNAKKVTLSPVKRIRATYTTPFQKDPFAVTINEKISLLLTAEKQLRVHPLITISQAFMRSFREWKTFASTEGSYITQELTECGAGLEATGVEGNEVQNRTYPNSFRGQSQTRGYELIEELDLVGHSPEIGDQAVALVKAPQCPTGEFAIILDGNQVALQVHESCGHPTELDRVLGMEANYAGTSFLTPGKLKNFRYGSDVVSITADATLPSGLGTFGYDDEGVPAQRFLLVDRGMFVGYLTSRETAHEVGMQANGTMRADGWSRLPLIRMTNINLEPGSWKLKELIADTNEGLFLSTNRSWSIDDQRLNFQFGTEIAWEIKNGKLGRVYKNPTYTGITPRFWNACDAVCNQDHWTIWGTPNCGKGEPSQVMHVGHGAAPARFRGIQVGVGKW